MTFRAILIGLLLGLGIAVFGYFNDRILRQAFWATNLTPVGVIGFLLVGLLVVNPLLKVMRVRQFGSGEWCVIASLMLVACVIPGPGLMWHFSNTLVMPHHYNNLDAGWRSRQVIRYVPDGMLVDPADNYDEVVGGFMGGIGGKMIALDRVPWGAWRKPLSFWLPLLGLSFIAGICLVMVVHRQWSKRERLRYPVAYVLSELIGGGRESPARSIFRDRWFWVGFGIPAAILLVNGYSAWNPRSIQVPLDLSLEPLAKKWPALGGMRDKYLYLHPALYFAAVGFAYFVSSEISFSLGITNIVYAAAFLSLSTLGVDVTYHFLAGGNYTSQMFGSYVGIAMVVFYAGRRYYLAVLSGAFGVSRGEPVQRSVVWSCRIALLAAAGMVVMLVAVLGMDWVAAVLFVMLTGLMFLVITRINAETGLFMIQPGWHVVGVLLGLFGFSAIGPHMLVALAILSLVLMVDPMVCLMPLAANALRMGEPHDIAPQRLSRWMAVSVLLALVAGVFATIWVQYSFGGGDRYSWANTTAKMPFTMLEGRLQGLRSDPAQRQGLRWDQVNPNASFLCSAAVGLGAALTLGAMRLRYHWWPIHPVLLLVWGTFPMALLAPSFLLGWLIKAGVTTFGGSQTYRKGKAFFIGLIAGEFAAGIFWMIVGAAYYAWTGIPGPMFRLLPD